MSINLTVLLSCAARTPGTGIITYYFELIPGGITRTFVLTHSDGSSQQHTRQSSGGQGGFTGLANGRYSLVATDTRTGTNGQVQVVGTDSIPEIWVNCGCQLTITSIAPPVPEVPGVLEVILSHGGAPELIEPIFSRVGSGPYAPVALGYQ